MSQRFGHHLWAAVNLSRNDNTIPFQSFFFFVLGLCVLRQRSAYNIKSIDQSRVVGDTTFNNSCLICTFKCGTLGFFNVCRLQHFKFSVKRSSRHHKKEPTYLKHHIIKIKEKKLPSKGITMSPSEEKKFEVCSDNESFIFYSQLNFFQIQILCGRVLGILRPPALVFSLSLE